MHQETYSHSTLIRNLLTCIRPYRARFFFASLLRITGEVMWLYPTYALAAITTFFTTYSVGESLLPFWHIMALLTLMTVTSSIIIYYANMIGYPVAERTALDAQLKALRHIFSLDMEWHEKENTGNKVKRIARGSNAVNQLIRMWFQSFIHIGVSVVGVLFIISHFDLVIASCTLLFLIIYFLVSISFTRKATSAKRAENIRDEEFSGLMFESVNNIRSVKVMTMASDLTERLTMISSELYTLIHRRIFWFQSGGATKEGIGNAFRILMLCFIGWGIMHGRYEIGFLVLFYGYFSTILSAVSRLAEVAQEFAIRKQDLSRMMHILEVAPVTDSEEGKVSFPINWHTIQFVNVSFSYEGKKVLNNITFSITRGEKIGIVGLSGSGKSTLLKLLLKERESYEGEILVDGVPLRTVSKTSYFKHTAVVLQDTEVFNFSLQHNITISSNKKRGNKKLLEQALTVAHVLEFARTLPEGIDTLIGEKGVKLSGGERQRIGIARAIFKNPQLLLLDEATSHLDVESEEKIRDSLHKFFQSVTAVVIAHRLTTIKEMDKILVMEGGTIIEQGTFVELRRQKGRFHELWEKQKL